MEGEVYLQLAHGVHLEQQLALLLSVQLRLVLEDPVPDSVLSVDQVDVWVVVEAVFHDVVQLAVVAELGVLLLR